MSFMSDLNISMAASRNIGMEDMFTRLSAKVSDLSELVQERHAKDTVPVSRESYRQDKVGEFDKVRDVIEVNGRDAVMMCPKGLDRKRLTKEIRLSRDATELVHGSIHEAIDLRRRSKDARRGTTNSPSKKRTTSY